MSALGPDLDAFLQLVDAAEAAYAYVTADRLRRVANSESDWQPLTRRLAALTRAALADAILLCDNRLRLRRDGTFAPIRLYRLNRRHPRVIEALA